ncbi:MAG TPA: prephenate dehydrogenase [Methanobacterium sp.]|nr:prephenate dehydrogenase [Methanobacterium sp.]
MQITVIGGTRGLGNWIAKFLSKKGCDVTITGRNSELGRSVAKKLGVKYTSNNKEATNNAQIVVIAVPIDNTPETIIEIAPHLKTGSLLMDVTSIKEEPAKIMEENIPEGVEYIPAHPMFGPRVRSLDGQVVVLTPIKKGNWYGKVFQFLKEENTHLIETTPQIHDQMMSVVQGLTHFTYISIAATLKKLEVDVKESRKFASPIYSLMLDMIARITAQNPYLCYSIQTRNKYILQTHNEFLDIYIELKKMIENNDESGFVQVMSNAAKHLDDLEAALGRSDKAISALNQEITYLKNSVGKEVGLRHIYSGKVHFGELKELSADFAVLDQRNKTVKLKVSNIEVLRPSELERFKNLHCPQKNFDVSVILPESADPELIAELIKSFNDVVDAYVLDVYQGSQIDEGMLSITFRYKVINSTVRNQVERLFKGFGGIIR